MATSTNAGLRTLSPIDSRVVVERPWASDEEIAAASARAVATQREWRSASLAERAALCSDAVDSLVQHRDGIAREITLQMGRPIAHSPGEVEGFEERARHMIAIAEGALAPVEPAPRKGFERRILREPLGVVLTIAPWNYPLLTAVNSVIPALMAGNTVLLRPSAQTPLCGERIAACFVDAGAPVGLVQVLHTDHDATERLIASPDVDFVAFTGSVEVGRRVQRAAAESFGGVGLELGGKDPAYVREDADMDAAVAGLVDGAFFNAGQSCCGIERIYVAASRFEEFVGRAAEAVTRYQLGDPLDPATTLGPLVRTSAADHVRRQITQALALGARALVDEAPFDRAAEGTPYLAPQVLVDVDHSMSVMNEESFGPVVGIMPARSDEHAIELMNDSDFGLSACVYTRDIEAARSIGERVETGTFFANRCDYLDPGLAWTGVKDSGRGCTLSALGYEALTRPKSFHLRLPAIS